MHKIFVLDINRAMWDRRPDICNNVFLSILVLGPREFLRKHFEKCDIYPLENLVKINGKSNFSEKKKKFNVRSTFY